jgi:hypothetical protein
VTRDKRPLRTYFYSGDEGTVIPEDAVLGADASGQLRQGPRYAYETELGNLYDLNADPSGLRALSDAYNLPFYKTTVPPYLIDFMKDTSLEGRALIPDAERLVRDFGYSGYLAGEGPQRAAAAVYDPVSGLKPIERGPKGYAEGGHASGYSA